MLPNTLQRTGHPLTTNSSLAPNVHRTMQEKPSPKNLFSGNLERQGAPDHLPGADWPIPPPTSRSSPASIKASYGGRQVTVSEFLKMTLPAGK